MHVVRARVTLTKIPVLRAHKMAIGTSQYQENVIVRLYTEDGVEGLGEAPHMVGVSLRGESPRTVLAMLRERLLSCVLGRSPFDVEDVQKAMDAAVPWNPRAKSAVNVAMYDLMGKILQTPAHNLLGGKVREAVPLSWSVPILDFETGAREAEDRVRRGWRILKIKFGRPNPMNDVEMVRIIRESVGPDVKLRVDANQAYDVKTAVRVAHRIERLDVEFFEQPIPWWDLDGLAEISRATELPIMADESAQTALEVLELIQRRAVQILSLYVSTSGGLLNAKRIAGIGAAAGLAGYIGGALDSAIGASAGLHLAASTPSITYGCELGGQFNIESSIGATPLLFQDGAVAVPQGPGLGVALDEDIVRRHAVEHFEVTGPVKAGVGA